MPILYYMSELSDSRTGDTVQVFLKVNSEHFNSAYFLWVSVGITEWIGSSYAETPCYDGVLTKTSNNKRWPQSLTHSHLIGLISHENSCAWSWCSVWLFTQKPKEQTMATESYTQSPYLINLSWKKCCAWLWCMLSRLKQRVRPKLDLRAQNNLQATGFKFDSTVKESFQQMQEVPWRNILANSNVHPTKSLQQ